MAWRDWALALVGLRVSDHMSESQGDTRRAEGVEPAPALRAPWRRRLPALLPLHVALSDVERKSHAEEGPSGKHPDGPHFTNSGDFLS